MASGAVGTCFPAATKLSGEDHRDSDGQGNVERVNGVRLLQVRGGSLFAARFRVFEDGVLCSSVALSLVDRPEKKSVSVPL